MTRDEWMKRLSELDFAKPVELDFLEADVPSNLFLEVQSTSRPSRRGWAPPRKRPRRIYKKLADRWFAAHHGGPAHGGSQRITHHESARMMQRELEKSGRLTFIAPDYSFDGETWSKTPKEMVEASAMNGGTYIEARYKRSSLQWSITDQPVALEQIEWRVRQWAHNSHVTFGREIELVVKVHAPRALRLPDTAIEQYLNRRFGAVMVALMVAEYPRDFPGRVLARHTSYRG